MKTITVKANDPKKGMTNEEISAALALAEQQNCAIGRTRVGFRGQIQEMNFKEREDES